LSARVQVADQVCELHGQCVEQAPSVFSFTADNKLRYRPIVDDEEIGLVEDAQFLCPTQAISLLRE
jgi:ferredoxin